MYLYSFNIMFLDKMITIFSSTEQTEQYKKKKCKKGGKAAYVLCRKLTSDLAKQ